MSVKKQDKSITQRTRAMIETLREKNANELSIAEKLMLNSYGEKREVIFGDVVIEMRVPMLKEVTRVSELMGEVRLGTANKDADKVAQATEELYEILADLCLDDSLDVEFFKSGYITSQDMVKIVREAAGMVDIKQIDNFRGE